MLERVVKNKSGPDSPGSEPAPKRSRVEAEERCSTSTLLPSLDEEDTAPGLLTLSDDVLLHIISFVGPSDLLALNDCKDPRLSNIVRDKSLWKKCDLRPRILSLGCLHEVLHWLQPSTTVFASSGPVEIMQSPKEGDIVEPTWLLSFMILLCKHAPKLKTLVLENHIVDCNRIQIDDFPPSIENLSLNNCIFINVPSNSSYFLGINVALTRLRSLDLTDTCWFEPHHLLALSKCTALEDIVLDGCDMAECMPYASLAVNYGFSNLRLLDLRNTAVGDMEVSCFNKLTTLRHLYISAAESSPFRTGSSHLFSNSNYVSDLSITTFGESPAVNVRRLIVILGGLHRIEKNSRPPCLLESLLLNNYPGITDLTLQHASDAMPHLKVLDLIDTKVTPSGVAKFKAERPRVLVVCSHKPGNE